MYPFTIAITNNKKLIMSVDLKNIPDISVRPSPPKLTRWMAVLVILIGLAVVVFRLMTGENNPWLTVGLPALAVGGLLFILLVIYLLRSIFANAHDRAREETIIREVRRGRRALQILAAECCTAHSSADNPFTTIGSHLIKNENVFFPQRSWRGEENMRLSQITRTGGLKEEQYLEILFTSLIHKMAHPLSLLPADRPVVVLLEHSSSVPEDKAYALFWQAWKKSGIKQPTSTLAGSGAEAIDRWLDLHIRSEAVLLVVSWQHAPANTLRSAEAISGVLLGNRLTQNSLSPLALLHRPESGEGAADALHYAILQALDWVPVKAGKLEHLWLSGVDIENEGYVTLMEAINAAGLESVDRTTGVHHFNEFLGDPGKAAFWLAVAAATQSMQQQPAYHLLISREQQHGKVWSMVVSPIAPVKESEA